VESKGRRHGQGLLLLLQMQMHEEDERSSIVASVQQTPLGIYT